MARNPRHYVIVNPALQCFGSPRIDIMPRRIVGKYAPLLDRDQVMRVRGVIFLLRGGRNLVVGLRQHAVKRNARAVVAISGKGINLGHGISGINFRAISIPLVYVNSPYF